MIRFLDRRVAGFIGLIILGCIIIPSIRVGIVDTYEDVSLALFPNAERAYAYGERHFSASNAAEYDIDRAKRYFEMARSLDPNLLYVNHELARIAFLHGNFNQALSMINFQISMHGDDTPNSYYIRGLIEGYMGDYAASAKDYEHFLKAEPNNWATMNDYAWVLLKAKRFKEAADITSHGLERFPDNPWLLNSNATALFELGRYQEALAAAKKASDAVALLTDAQWSHAYPGNDPQVASAGVATFKKAVADNIHSIELAIASSTVQ